MSSLDLRRLAQGRRPIILCLSHLRWDFVFQRPQHLMTRAAENNLVLFFEEPIFENREDPDLRLRFDHGVIVATPLLPPTDPARVSAILRSMIDQLLERQSYSHLTLWYYTPMALEFSRHLEADLCIYDCMDELSAFKGAPRKLKDMERELLRKSDLVFTGGQSLYEAKRERHSHAHCFPSSVNVKHFAQARDKSLPEPEDMKPIPGPRIGFFGVIDERMDSALVRACARQRPDWSFVMLGPVVKIDPDSLPKEPNIFWLGMKRYEELPGYLAHWDIGFMPFAINAATRFISPTKTPEFLAAGLPVVSTPIRDVVRGYGKDGLVEIAAGPEQFVSSTETLMRSSKIAWLARVDAKLASMSWDKTWEDMAALMKETTARHTIKVSLPSAPALRGAFGGAHV